MAVLIEPGQRDRPRRRAFGWREAGIPVLEGTATGLAAFRHLFEYRDFRARPPLAAPPARRRPAEVRGAWAARLGDGTPLSESEGLALLADYGVPVAASREAGVGRRRRSRRPSAIGWPVALKTAAPGRRAQVRRRTAFGSASATRTACGRRTPTCPRGSGPRVTGAAMAPPGVEMALGLVRDEQFGPLVLVAAGGVLVELLGDRRLALPPVDEVRRAVADRPAADAAAARRRPRRAGRPTSARWRGSSSPSRGWRRTSATGWPPSTSTR